MASAKAALLEEFTREHSQLSDGLAALTAALDGMRDGVEVLGARSLAESRRFIQQVLIPHAEWEELTFYPALGGLVREHADPNAGMLIDHREILSRVEAFLALVARIEAGERDPEVLDRARILGYQVRALVDLHCRKEEEIYCAVLRRHLSDREAVHALAVGDQHGHD